MSRCDELRQLAAQLSVLAALEDSIALGLSKVMGPAGSGRSAAPSDAGSPSAPAAPAASPAVPSPSHQVAASLLRSATLSSATPRARTRSRSPVPLPKRAPRAPRRSSSTASGLRGSVALAESGLVTGLATKCCPPVPPPQLRLSRVSRALHAASAGPPPPVEVSGPSAPSAPASEAPCAAETASNSDDDWDALLDALVSLRLWVAPRPPKPSRPTPLVLVGGLATNVAVANARPPSAPCGGKYDGFLPAFACSRPARRPAAAQCASLLVLGLFSAGFARLISGVCCAFSCLLCAVRACPCWLLAVVRQTSLSLSPRMRRSPTRAITSLESVLCGARLSSTVSSWRGRQFPVFVETWKPNKSYYVPRTWLRDVELSLVRRAQRSSVDHSNVISSCSGHVCMRPPSAVISTLFCDRRTL